MLRLLSLLLILAACAAPAQAKKVALVIANGDYASVADLANPPNDARLVARALDESGFDTVTLAANLPYLEFQQALREFRDSARGADTALLYYAGHGIEGRGQNWLVPTDAALEREADLPYDAIELDLAMEALDGAALKIAVLDACRNNPFASEWTGATRSVARGLARVEVDDVLVIYAAAPGQVAFDGAGEHSPFAASLARRIVQPGLPVQMLGGMVRDDVLAATQGEQRPYISASITGRPLYLVDGPAPAAIAANTLVEGSRSGSRGFGLMGGVTGSILNRVAGPVETRAERDAAAWRKALETDTIDAYRAYLAKHPDGAFAPFAQGNIDQILDPTALGGELRPSPRGLVSITAALPGRDSVRAGNALPFDGIWRIASIDKRIRFEGGRAFAVDAWNHLLVFRVQPEQVVLRDLVQTAPGEWSGRDILLQVDARMTLRENGDMDLRLATFPFPTTLLLERQALDDPEALPPADR